MELLSEEQIYNHISKEELNNLKGMWITDCINLLLENGYDKDIAETIAAFVYAKNQSSE
jgi:hypothetical protein